MAAEYPVPFNVTNVIAIAAGGNIFSPCERMARWSAGATMPLARRPFPRASSNIVAISAGANHSVLLRNDGTVLTLGAYTWLHRAVSDLRSDLANVIAIASSGDHDLATVRHPRALVHRPTVGSGIPLNAVTNITLAAKCAGVQPVRYQWQLNGTNVPGATNDTLLLSNNPSAIRPDECPSRRALTNSSPAMPMASPPANTPRSPRSSRSPPRWTRRRMRRSLSVYNWITSGNAQWFGETNITHDGVDAAQSGGIGALQETILQTTVGTNWPGSYTFWWNVSSEQDFDFLEFRMNGIAQTNISGQLGWQPVSIHVAAGTNVLHWRYYKDASSTWDWMPAGWINLPMFPPGRSSPDSPSARL